MAAGDGLLTVGQAGDAERAKLLFRAGHSAALTSFSRPSGTPEKNVATRTVAKSRSTLPFAKRRWKIVQAAEKWYRLGAPRDFRIRHP